VEIQRDLPTVLQAVKPVVPSPRCLGASGAGAGAAGSCATPRHGTATLPLGPWAFLPHVPHQSHCQQFPRELRWVCGPSAASPRRSRDLPEAGDTGARGRCGRRRQSAAPGCAQLPASP